MHRPRHARALAAIPLLVLTLACPSAAQGTHQVPVTADQLTSWQLWWQFNEPRYLNRRQAVPPLIKGLDDIYLPTLRQANAIGLAPPRSRFKALCCRP